MLLFYDQVTFKWTQINDVEPKRFGTPTELTIAGGAITVTKNYHRVDTQGDDPADDLNTINGGTDGMLLVLRQENITRDVTVEHNVGNIKLDGNADCVLSTPEQKITLIYDLINTQWSEISRTA